METDILRGHVISFLFVMHMMWFTIAKLHQRICLCSLTPEAVKFPI